MIQIIKHTIDPRQKGSCEFFGEYLDWQYSEKNTEKPDICRECSKESCFEFSNCLPCLVSDNHIIR